MSTATQKGFGVVEVILVVVLVAIVGFVGWRVYDSTTTKQAPTTTPTPTQSTNPTASYTTKYEKLSFTYPTALTLTDTSREPIDEKDINKYDSVTLDSKDGFELRLNVGMLDGLGGGCSDCKIALSQPITIFGKPAYVNYVTDSQNQQARAVVATEKDDKYGLLTIDENNNYVPHDPKNDKHRIILIHSEDNLTFKQFKNDPTVKEMIEVIESMKY